MSKLEWKDELGQTGCRPHSQHKATQSSYRWVLASAVVPAVTSGVAGVNCKLMYDHDDVCTYFVVDFEQSQLSLLVFARRLHKTPSYNWPCFYVYNKLWHQPLVMKQWYRCLCFICWSSSSFFKSDNLLFYLVVT